MSYVYLVPYPTPRADVCYGKICLKTENGPAWALTGAAIVLGSIWVASKR